MKRCQQCGDDKDIEAFARWKYAPDGRQRLCRECQSTNRRAAYVRRMTSDDVPAAVECIVCGAPAVCGLDNPYYLNQFSDDFAAHQALCGKRCRQHLLSALARMTVLLGLAPWRENHRESRAA